MAQRFTRLRAFQSGFPARQTERLLLSKNKNKKQSTKLGLDWVH